MATYKFKLQNVLNIKENIETEKKNEFGLAVQRLDTEKSRQEELRFEMQEANSIFEDETKQGIPISQLKLYADAIEYYKKRLKNQRMLVKMAEDYLESCREELIKATQEKKMIEKLKEIDHVKYLYEEQKKEDKLVDDLVSFKESQKD